MANTNLYDVLSSLYTTDSLIWNKVKGLSGAVSGAFTQDKVAVGSGSGLSASQYTLGLDGTNLAEAATDNVLATEKAVRAYVEAQEQAQGIALTGVLGSDTIDAVAGTKNVTVSAKFDGKTIGADASGLKSLVTLKSVTPSGDYASIYELQDKDGTRIGDQINIVKDQFLKTASYDSENEELVFTFTVPSGELVTRVNAHDLVHELSGSNAITVTDVKGGQSEISLKLDIATAGTESGDGKFLSVTSNGLLLSGVQAAIDAAVADAKSDATDGLEVLSAALTDFLGENAVSGKFASVDSEIDALKAKTSGSIAEGKVVIGGASGQYVDGGLALGSDDTLSGAFGLTANTLATEVAAKAYADGAIAAQAAADDARLDKLEAQFANVDSTLSSNLIVETDSTGKIITNGHAVAASSVAWDETSDAYVPTMKAVTDFVEANLDAIDEAISTLQSNINA